MEKRHHEQISTEKELKKLAENFYESEDDLETLEENFEDFEFNIEDLPVIFDQELEEHETNISEEV